jgi:hypothetical protein
MIAPSFGVSLSDICLKLVNTDALFLSNLLEAIDVIVLLTVLLDEPPTNAGQRNST